MAAAALFAGGAAILAAQFGDLTYHAVPLRWTGEAERLGRAIGIGPGSTVADIGAGTGALVVELAKLVGNSGAAYATERTPEQRAAIAQRAASAGRTITVIEAAERATNLPDACCAGITMRLVTHHVGDLESFARDVRRSLQPGGRIGIVDFAPGSLPHLEADHGIDPATVIGAFTSAGFSLQTRDDRWGGRTYLLVFRAP